MTAVSRPLNNDVLIYGRDDIQAKKKKNKITRNAIQYKTVVFIVYDLQEA